ncbi:UvrD-helicase domain-containing protein [uncultured Roseivirga sp.]|uniref:UvrD-helicase domain-containing protein n=1 Tax=uncultured Roseivirga sp. TaxID=543088 RepID=UPI0030DD5C37|tara:strand:- start:3222 stop:5219 length:1998 start_codon:yes stop_codon:yes gene_type:complete
MPVTITKSDIRFAERVLFGKTHVFDQQRIDYIQNLDTLDLQAVPGSGKTTVLLAKLLILERHLPLEQGAGILVLSHTNIAVDEIKRRIGKHCPKLFSYPNFVGTIQSFVDQFLAIPFYNTVYGKSHHRIDNEVYDERLEKLLKFCLQGQTQNTFNKVAYVFRANPKLIYSMRYGLDDTGNVIIKKGVSGTKIDVSKPRGNTRPENYRDYSDDEKQQVYAYLFELKKRILASGVLCYDEAYFLAQLYLRKYPEIKKVIQKRFKYVFVDEMQDMDFHQCDILDRLFKTKKVRSHAFQRVGDKNQAIFSGNAEMINVWEDREKVMRLSGSQRLSPQIANAVKYFGLDFIDIVGKNMDRNLQPVAIVFGDATINQVLERFTTLITEYQNDTSLPQELKHPVKAIGWSTSNDAANKLGIVDYHQNFRRDAQNSKIDYPNLKSYLFGFDTSKGTLEPIRKNILNALLRVLRLENILHDDRPFTKRKLLNLLINNYFDLYEDFNLNIYNWAINLVSGNADRVHTEVAAHFRGLIGNVFSKTEFQASTNTFLNNEDDHVIPVLEERENPNFHHSNGITVEVGTVHSVKGETHSATLYLETCFYRHETDKSKNQLIGNQVRQQDSEGVKKSAKMMYVGFSRPTSLLCYATHTSRVNDELRQNLTNHGWRIVDLT